MRKSDYVFLTVLIILIIALIISLKPKAEPNHCNDKILDYGEEHVDCGGECIACSSKYPHYFLNKHRNIIGVGSIILIFLFSSFAFIYLKKHHHYNPKKEFLNLIRETENALESDIAKAGSLYKILKTQFSQLPPKDKKELYPKAFNLYKQIKTEKEKQGKNKNKIDSKSL